MKAHELAKRLLELPEDTMILYYEEAKMPFATIIDNFISVNTNVQYSNNTKTSLNEGNRQIPSTYFILNPRT